MISLFYKIEWLNSTFTRNYPGIFTPIGIGMKVNGPKMVY